MQPIYVSKSLVTASTNIVGSVSTAATSVVTVNSSNMPLDTQRRIVFSSTAADTSTLRLTITGTREGGGVFSETVAGSTAGAGTAATTTSDFLTVTAISVSSNANVPILVGTSSVGGTAWKLTNWHVEPPMQIGGALTFSSSGNGMTGVIDLTMDDPTRTYPNPLFAVPTIFNSTTHLGVAGSSNTWGILNADANNLTPVAAWRLTITSSSSSAGTVSATIMQAGIG